MRLVRARRVAYSGTVMHFDDRLGTVLRLRADGPVVRRIQFRQLIDLLGTSPVEARGEQIDAAFVRLAELATLMPVADRVVMLRDRGLRLRSPRLVAALATGEPAVAEAVIEQAELDEEQWLDLIPALPPAARGHVLRRRDLGPALRGLLHRLGVIERGLPPVAMPLAGAPTVPPEPANDADPLAHEIPAEETSAGIGAIVRRIEAYRKARQSSDDSPRLPLGEDHVLTVPARVSAFDFASDAEGRIVWSDPGVAPMVGGAHLGAEAGATLRLAAETSAPVERRQPIAAGAVTIAGAPAIAGVWTIDAAPWFDPLTARFMGYRGRLRRPAADLVPPPARDSEADRIRQMLHELRTPVNAIQGFAEVIQQQLFGPTPHDYRALAAAIAGDAARMLSAFEELERLARLDSGAMELEAGATDLAAIIAATAAQLEAHSGQRGSGFAVDLQATAAAVPLAALEVERLVWRLLATLAGTSAPGERLALRLSRSDGGTIRLELALPASLAARACDDLFRAAAGAIPQVLAAGVFGVGFALRLARAEARAAGGDLVCGDSQLVLTLPGLTGGAGDHTQGGSDAAARG